MRIIRTMNRKVSMKAVRKPFFFHTYKWISILLLAGSCATRSETLKDAAGKWPGLKIGSAVDPNALGAVPLYAATLRLQYSLASPENDLKWAALRPAEYVYSSSKADTTLQFDAAGGQSARGHNLLWYHSLPSWLTSGGYTTNQVRDYLFHHIDTVAGRYRGSLFCWDVVNEAFDSNGLIRTTNFWYDNPGIGDFNPANSTLYIEEAFRRANIADSNARLIYNDYSTETTNAKSDAVYAMARDFLNRGVPLHGIGFQMHVGESGINYNSMRTNFERFNNLGLDLQITEMSVPIPETNGVAAPGDLAAQAEVYWNTLSVALGQPHFTVFQTWGFSDAYDNGYTGGFPFDQRYQKKPAYWAIWNALANQAEKLPVLFVSSGDTTTVFSQDTLSAGAGRQLIASGVNSSMTLGVDIPFAGQWNVKIGYRQSGASGEFQTAVTSSNSPDYANLGSIIDAYGASIGASVTDLGAATFTNAGTWKFRFTVTGKNSSASGYNVTIDYIRITPLAVTNTPPTISTITDITVNENTTAGPYSFTIGDAETPANLLTVQAVSLNTNLLPAVNIILSGSGSSQSATLIPATNQYGSAGVLLLVSDGTNQTPATFTLNVKQVNAPPTALGTNLILAAGGSMNLDLHTLVSDNETSAAGLTFSVNNPGGGLVTLLSDGHTARFTATNNFGTASFNYSVTDQGPDPRWLLYYNFEPPDLTDDKSVTDNSIYRLAGTLEEFGNGTSDYDTNVPSLLAPFSTRSLALNEFGDGNGARLAALLPTNIYSLASADWTMTTWFRHTTIPNATNVDFIFYTGAGDAFGGTGDELCLYINSSSQIQLQHYNTNSVLDVNITGSVVPTNEWHHVALVFTHSSGNSGKVSLFLDGIQVGGSVAVSWFLDQDDALIFGGVTEDRESRWFDGNLDDIALYGAALSSSEITKLAGGASASQLGGLSATNTINFIIPFSNQPPVLAAISNTQLIAGVPFIISPGGADPDMPAQTLVFRLLSAPSGAAINLTNGLITWRPTMAQSGTSNLFTIVASEAGWFTNLTPLADTYARDGSFANSNFGADTILTVKQDPTAGFSRESFLRFALPSFPGMLANAQLFLQPVYASLPGTHAVALVTNDVWDEATLTWNNKPVSGPLLATWLPQSNVLAQIPVAAAVQQDFSANGLLSLRIYATNSTSDGRVDYASKEAGTSLAPKLSLLYTNAQPLSATQSFWVNVTPPQPPMLSGMQYAAGAFRMNIAGDGGPDYRVLASTNLLFWETVFTTNSPALPFIWMDSATNILPQRFYRVQLGP
jgi:endo-1,4-beta-xylanase